MNWNLKNAFALVALALLGTANADAQSIIKTFTYEGGAQTFIVPSDVTNINVYLWGAGSGGGGYYGGGGAFVSGILSVTPKSILTIVIGSGGGGSNAGGGGGGRSAIQSNNMELVDAGSGGGGARGTGGAGGVDSGMAGASSLTGGLVQFHVTLCASGSNASQW